LIFDSGQAGNSGWLASVSIIEVVIWNLPQNGQNAISDTLDFKIFPGEHAPGPPRTLCV
jgi:hypothetical protein